MEFDSNQLEENVQASESSQSADSQPKKMSDRHGFAKWGGLVVLSLALAIIIIDTTILNVAFSTILNDLHTTIENMQWVITAYALMLAAFTITGGKLGDIFGRKKLFMLGAIIFAIGSFISSISHNVGTLIIGEAIIEGIGAALMLPATSSLLVSNYEGRDRATAFGIWGGVAGASAALGPILGGYLTTDYSWRWGFRVNIVVVLVLLAGSYMVHEVAEEIKKTSIDFVGVILSAVGLLSIVFGIIKASDYGWIISKSPFHVFGHFINLGKLSPSPLFVLLGLIILTFFIFWEQRLTRLGREPLISVDIFKNRQFVAGAATTAMVTLAQTGIIFTLPVFLQSVRGFSAFHTGIALLPLSIMLLIGSPIALLLSRKIPPKVVIGLGLLLSTAAGVWLHFAISSISGTKELLLPLGLYGLGLGLILSQITNITLSAVPTSEAGEASGINNTFRQLGSTLGSAIIGAVLISSLTLHLQSGIQASTIIPTQSKPAIAAAASAQASSIEFGNAIGIGSMAPVAISNEVAKIAHAAATTATRTTVWYTAGFAFLAFLVSLSLPRKKKEDDVVAASVVPSNSGNPLTLPKQFGRMSIDEALAATTIPATIVSSVHPSPVSSPDPSPHIVPVPAPSPAEVLDTVVRTTEQKVSIEQKTPSVNYGRAITAGVFALLIAAAAGLFGGYALGKHHTQQTKIAVVPSIAAPGPLYTILSATPTADTTSTEPLSSFGGTSSNVQRPEVLGTSTVSSSSASTTPVSVAQQATTKTYTYSGASLAITIPTSWTIAQSEQDGTILRILDASQNLHGQLFIQAGVSERLDQKRTELQANPEVSDIADTSFHGIPALSYVQDGISGTNIVLEYKGNLYTLNQGAQHEGDGYSLKFY